MVQWEFCRVKDYIQSHDATLNGFEGPSYSKRRASKVTVLVHAVLLRFLNAGKGKVQAPHCSVLVKSVACWLQREY